MMKKSSDLGYNAEFAQDGNEAIDLYQDAMQCGRPFDAVILDLTIRGGMGGQEAIQKLIKIDPNIKGIVSSGYPCATIINAQRRQLQMHKNQ